MVITSTNRGQRIWHVSRAGECCTAYALDYHSNSDRPIRHGASPGPKPDGNISDELNRSHQLDDGIHHTTDNNVSTDQPVVHL